MILRAEPGVQPGNVPLDAPSDADPARRAPVVVAEGRFDGNAEGMRAEEARVIAGLLHAARRDGWEIRDRHDENAWRTCRWGDMAVLMPARTGIEHYEQALAAAGIPYRHEGSRDFFQRDEVRDLIWVLSAIDDPTDRLALVGSLRSSAFAISDEELVIHVAAAGPLNYRSPRKGPSDIVNEALAELYDLHKMRRGLSLAEVVRRVVERTRLVEFALTQRDGEQGAANLLAIVDDARLFAAAGGGGLRPFIRHLRDSMEQEAIEIEATVAEETDDVVRIMTMHGAKGLEFPIVALANLGGTGGTQRAPVPREHESFLHFRVGAGSLSRSGHFATPGYDEVWEAEKRYGEAERLRLLYVAATRAREHLLVPCVVGRAAAKGLLGALVHALPTDSCAGRGGRCGRGRGAGGRGRGGCAGRGAGRRGRGRGAGRVDRGARGAARAGRASSARSRPPPAASARSARSPPRWRRSAHRSWSPTARRSRSATRSTWSWSG